MSLDGVHHGVNIQDELQRVLDEDQHYDIMFTSMNEAFTRPGDDPGDTAYGVHTLLRRASIFAQIDYEHHTIIKFTDRALRPLKLECTVTSVRLHWHGIPLDHVYSVRQNVRDRHELLKSLYTKIRRSDERYRNTEPLRRRLRGIRDERRMSRALRAVHLADEDVEMGGSEELVEHDLTSRDG